MSHHRLSLVAFGLALLIVGRKTSAQIPAQPVVNHWIEPTAKHKALPLAIGGYCVVSLRDRQQWQPGDPQIAAEFDGHEYRFASPRDRDIFSAAPVSYAPVLGGDCPVTFAESGKRTPGLLERGVLHRERLSFFASEEIERKFLDDPRQYDEADVALEGRCPVSRLERRLEKPGIPATAVLYQGLRYFFASAYERSLFLADPRRYSGQPLPQGKSASPLVATPARPAPDEKAAAPPAGAPRRQRRGHFGNDDRDVILGASPAMGGYCPVSLKNQGVWVRGRYEFRVDLGGLTLLAAGPKEKETLLANPTSYIPVLGGDCPITYLSRHEHIRGSVFQAVEFQGRLYLFADADRKAVFKSNPAPYIDIDLAEKGVCVVTRIEERRDVPGLAEHSTWYRGKMYRFAGPEQMEKFLAQPTKYAVDVDK
jgi:YHS domain-containing protein